MHLLRSLPISRVAQLLAGVLALGSSTLLISQFSAAALVATTDNTGNSITSAAIDLTDDDLGTALFSVTGITDTFSSARCITVTYTSPDVGSDVMLYVANLVDSDLLGANMNVTVERGDGSTDATCTGFTPSSTIYTGTLAGLSSTTSFGTGLGPWSAAAGGDSESYRITAAATAGLPIGAAATFDLVFESQTTS